MGNKKHFQEEIDIFWSGLLQETDRVETNKYLEVFRFELTKELANELLYFVLIGQTKATSSSLWAYSLFQGRGK